MMLFKEKYRNELLELFLEDKLIAVVNGIPCECDDTIPCEKCDLFHLNGEEHNCAGMLAVWAKQEYRPQKSETKLKASWVAKGQIFPIYTCSLCKGKAQIETMYCPHCGAKMENYKNDK